MATKTAKVESVGMFTREERPKRISDNFKGRTVDADKIEYIKSIISEFQSAEMDLAEREQVSINDLNGYKATSLAANGNALLAQYEEQTGKPVGFYFVATEHEKLEDGKMGQPTKLVIREGSKPKRNRKSNSDNSEA